MTTDWRASVVKVLGATDKTTTDPIKLIQNVLTSPHPPAVGPNNAAFSRIRPRLISEAALDEGFAKDVEQAFNGSGQTALESARRLGVEKEFLAGGIKGLRP